MPKKAEVPNRLAQLKTSLEGLSSDELLEKVKQIRTDRKISKRTLKTQTGVKKERTRKKTTDMFDKLTPEQKAALLKELESMDG